MELRLTKGGDSFGSEVRVRFPAELDAVWSAIDELEQYSTDDGPVQIEEAVCPVANLTGYVRCANLEEGSDIQKLNLLTLRINDMSPQEQQLFSGALNAESINGLDDVLRIAGSLDRYEMIEGVTSDRKLGGWLVKHDQLGAKFPKEVWPYLDYSAIGAEYYANHGGSYSPNGYVKRREDIPVQTETPRVMLLTLTAAEKSCTLVLPSSVKQLEHTKEILGIEDFSQAAIKSAEYVAPYLDRLIPQDCITVEDANELACCRQQIQAGGGMMKYCAALAAEQPNTFFEAFNIAINHDDYEQVTYDADEYGKQVLRRIGCL